MSWYIYKFKHNDKAEILHFPIKNKNINEVRYNIRSGRLRIAISDINDYQIIQLSELSATKKNEALIEFNEIMSKSLNQEEKEDNLKNIIKKINKLEIEDLTKKSYIDFATNIFKIYFGSINNLHSFGDIVKDKKVFIDKMKSKYSNITTQREYIVKFLRIVKLLEYDEETINNITEVMYDYQDKHLDEQDEKRKIEITITREELITKSRELFDNDEIDLMTLLILLIHIIYPKRDDYKNIKMIYNNRSDEELINDVNIQENYDGVYIVSKHKFIIMKYKNSKKMKEDIFNIEDPFLMSIIGYTIIEYPNRDLFYHNSKGIAYKSVSNIIKKYLDVSLNDLRKIYTKDVGTYKAKEMLKHSATTSRTYYKRK